MCALLEMLMLPYELVVISYIAELALVTLPYI